MTLDQLKQPRRAVALAGGPRKFAAIQGALRGRHVNVLITDLFTADRLAGEAIAVSTVESQEPPS